MGTDYSKYFDVVTDFPPDICMVHIHFCLLFGINIPDNIQKEMWDCLCDLFHIKGKIKHYSKYITKFKADKFILMQTSSGQQSAKGKKLFCMFHKIFCKNGWTLINSPTLTYENTLSSWIFFREVNPFMMKTANVESDFCAISLSSGSDIQFISFPEELKDSIVTVIREIWKNSVSYPHVYPEFSDAWYISLGGKLWISSGEESLSARSLVLEIVRFMSRSNWRLINSTGMKPSASDTLFFRHYDDLGSFNTTPDGMPDYYFMLALMNPGYMCVLGGDDYIHEFLMDSAIRHEPEGIKPKTMNKGFPAIEFISDVWSRRNEHETKTKRLLALMFQDLASIGWMPIESMDCSRNLRELSNITFVRIPPVRMMYFCLAIKKYQGFTLINATEEIQNLVFTTFGKFYAVNDEPMRQNIHGDCPCLEFKGEPYSGFILFSTLLFLQSLTAVMSVLKSVGWHLVVSADTSNETVVKKRGKNSHTLKWSVYSLWFAKVFQ